MTTSPQRIVVYLSGGGYRAAIAAIGALLAVVAAGQWQDVRKIVSVSGGGLVNAWIAIRRPGSDQELVTALEDLYELLTNRQRSVRHLLVAVIVSLVPVSASVSIGLAFAPVLGAWIWAYAIIAFFVSIGGLVWLAPRVFLAQDYKVFAGRLGSLRESGWHREHVFVSSDLWLSGYVGITAHIDQSFIAAPPLQPIDASALNFSTALRASTALPPMLPTVRLGIARPVDPTGSGAGGNLGRTRSLWLIDGGATGNLGIQTDPGITGVTTQFDTVLTARRALDSALGTVDDSLDDLTDQSGFLQEANEELTRGLQITLIYDRLMTDPVTARVVRRVQSLHGHPNLDDLKLVMADSDSPAALEASRRMQRDTALVVRAVLEEPELAGFALTEQERGAFDDPIRIVRKTRTPRPECGHDASPWSSCIECPTLNLVVDASGRPSHAGRTLRFLLWVPGAGTIVNAMRTLQILYQENLQEDRKTSMSGTVPVLRADDIYLKEARVSRSRTPTESHARWVLANNGLSGPWRASLPLPAYVRAQLREDAARFKTQLMAPSPKDLASAQATLASAYIGTADLLHRSEVDLEVIYKDLEIIDSKISRVIRDAVSTRKDAHAQLAPLAQAERLKWVIGLRMGFREVVRAGKVPTG
ncbi:hypothetical protein ACX80H_03945 [Arthrobacter sp. MDT2-2]